MRGFGQFMKVVGASVLNGSQWLIGLMGGGVVGWGRWANGTQLVGFG